MHRFLALLTVAAAAVALAAPALALPPIETRLHLSDRAPAFHGSVHSTPRCERHRIVRMFKVRPGADRKLGRAHSDSDGHWLVFHPNNSSGEYYATVQRKPSHIGNEVCGRDESNHVVID